MTDSWTSEEKLAALRNGANVGRSRPSPNSRPEQEAVTSHVPMPQFLPPTFKHESRAAESVLRQQENAQAHAEEYVKAQRESVGEPAYPSSWLPGAGLDLTGNEGKQDEASAYPSSWAPFVPDDDA